jgi:hypothetical protein
MRRFVLSLGLTMAAPTGASCAASDDELRQELKAERDEELSLVSKQDLARLAPDSPQRAVMAFWRAIQLRHAKAARALLTRRRTRPQLPKAEPFLVGQAGVGTATSEPVPTQPLKAEVAP